MRRLICWLAGHRRKPIRATAIDEAGIAAMFSGHRAFTSILFLCSRCGEHEVGNFPGQWTIEDFTRTTSEKEEFEKIVGVE